MVVVLVFAVVDVVFVIGIIDIFVVIVVVSTFCCLFSFPPDHRVPQDHSHRYRGC